MFKTSSTAGPLPSLNTLDRIARKSGLIKRQSSKFSAHGFLISLIKSVISGKSSLNQLAINIGDFESANMSRQAMHQRFGDSASLFLTNVLKEIIKTKTKSLFSVNEKLPFERILVEDCTMLPMHKSNCENFPGNGNRRGKTAGAKVHLMTDWLSGEVTDSGFYSASSPDQSLNAEVLNHCKKGDLIIRDMGFYKSQTIKAIEEAKAFWISRLPASVSASSYRGVDLEKRLKHEKADQFEMVVYVGKENRHKCRLVATRLSEEQTEKNRRERHRNSKRHGYKAKEKGLIRDQWSLLLTNLTKSEASSKLLYQLYNLRWNIEIQFRGLKQSSHIQKSLNRKTSYNHNEALVLATMIYQIITLKIHKMIRASKKTIKLQDAVSYEKLAQNIAHFLLKLSKWNLYQPFEPDKRHISHDTRKRKTLYSKGVTALT